MNDTNLYGNGQQQRQPPRDELDLYDTAIDAAGDDEFLRGNKLGLGNYSDKEMWQQVESFGIGLYALSAFETKLERRQIEETKLAMAHEAWNDLDEDEREQKDKRRFIEREKKEQWQSLAPEDKSIGDAEDRLEVMAERQAEEIQKRTGQPPGWTPPHLRMLLMRHEASRSRGARLMDNLFGRVQEIFKSGDDDADGINLRDAR